MLNQWEIQDQAQKMLNDAQQARQQIAAMLTEISRQRAELAAVALWCSLGEHAFGSQDRKRTTFTIDTFDDDGEPVKQQLTACGACSEKRRGMFQPVKALPAKADPEEYRRYLEWKAGLGAEPGRDGDPS